MLVAVSTDFLGTTLNNKTFQEITQKNLDYRFRLIKKDFEYSIMIAKEEASKIATSLSIGYNSNVENRSKEYIQNYMKNFLSATVNEFNLSFNRNISIIFHSEIGRNTENPFNMYEYSTLYNKFSEITPTNETMWINSYCIVKH